MPWPQVRQNHGHCLEGALVGAYVLGMHGFGARLMDLRADGRDDDHVVMAGSAMT